MTNDLDSGNVEPKDSSAPDTQTATTSAPATQADGTVAAPAEPKGYWPDDWRTKTAEREADPKEREKFLKRLERFSSPDDAFKALREQDKKLSSGKLIEPLPDKPTPEQLADWRKKNGIPLEPKDYDLKLDGGVIIGDEDRPLVEKFVERMHKAHATPAQVNEAIQVFYDLRQDDSRALAEFDATRAKEAEDVLREEWGGEYRMNMNINDNLLATVPEDVRENLLGGRMKDGTLVKDSPEFRRMLNSLAREANPIATVVPASGQNGMEAIDSEIASIKGKMHTKAYTPEVRARYRQLLEAKEKYARK